MGAFFSSFGGKSKEELFSELNTEYNTYMKLQDRYNNLKTEQDDLVVENEGLNNKLNDKIFEQGKEKTMCEQNIQTIMANNNEEINNLTKTLGEINAYNKALEVEIEQLKEDKQNLEKSRSQKMKDFEQYKNKEKVKINEWLDNISSLISAIEKEEYLDYTDISSTNEWTLNNIRELNDRVNSLRKTRLSDKYSKDLNAIKSEMEKVKRYVKL